MWRQVNWEEQGGEAINSQEAISRFIKRWVGTRLFQVKIGQQCDVDVCVQCLFAIVRRYQWQEGYIRTSTRIRQVWLDKIKERRFEVCGC